MKATKTTAIIHDIKDCRTVDTPTLQRLLSCGRFTATEIATAAGARVKVGRRILWNVNKIQQYLDSISE